MLDACLGNIMFRPYHQNLPGTRFQYFVSNFLWHSSKTTINIHTKTPTWLSGHVESLCFSILNSWGSGISIVTDPTPPWGPPTALVCRADGKPSTWFPSKKTRRMWDESYFSWDIPLKIMVNCLKFDYGYSAISSWKTYFVKKEHDLLPSIKIWIPLDFRTL